MNPHNLSIDISGLWSRAQARAVIEALREELAERHLRLEMVDASSMSESRFYLVARCACCSGDWSLVERDVMERAFSRWLKTRVKVGDTIVGGGGGGSSSSDIGGWWARVSNG